MKTTTRIKPLFMLAAIAVSMLTLASCSKNDPAPADETPMQELLVGSWELVKVESLDGEHQEEIPKGMIMTLTADGEFMDYLDGKLMNSGTYTLEGDELTKNYQSGGTNIFTLIFPDKDTLVMVDEESNFRFTLQRTETLVSSIVVIDGVQEPVLSADVNSGEPARNNYRR